MTLNGAAVSTSLISDARKHGLDSWVLLGSAQQAVVEAVLQLWEGQSHAQYNRDINAPETREYNEEIARFFDLHLGR